MRGTSGKPLWYAARATPITLCTPSPSILGARSRTSMSFCSGQSNDSSTTASARTRPSASSSCWSRASKGRHYIRELVVFGTSEAPIFVVSCAPHPQQRRPRLLPVSSGAHRRLAADKPADQIPLDRKVDDPPDPPHQSSRRQLRGVHKGGGHRPRLLPTLLRDIRYRREMAASDFTRDDGTLLVRRPFDAANVGRNMSDLALFHGHAESVLTGSYRPPSPRRVQ